MVLQREAVALCKICVNLFFWGWDYTCVYRYSASQNEEISRIYFFSKSRSFFLQYRLGDLAQERQKEGSFIIHQCWKYLDELNVFIDDNLLGISSMIAVKIESRFLPFSTSLTCMTLSKFFLLWVLSLFCKAFRRRPCYNAMQSTCLELQWNSNKNR